MMLIEPVIKMNANPHRVMRLFLEAVLYLRAVRS